MWRDNIVCANGLVPQDLCTLTRLNNQDLCLIWFKSSCSLWLCIAPYRGTLMISTHRSRLQNTAQCYVLSVCSTQWEHLPDSGLLASGAQEGSFRCPSVESLGWPVVPSACCAGSVPVHVFTTSLWFQVRWQPNKWRDPPHEEGPHQRCKSIAKWHLCNEVPGRCGSNFKSIILKLSIQSSSKGTCCEIPLNFSATEFG